MGRYSIKQLEQLSGVKAHTIRIWEQRYDIVIPHRTETNIRFYDDIQLKKLLNVALLVQQGHKISKIGKLEEEEIQDLVADKLINTVTDDQVEVAINGMLLSMIDYDEAAFERIFSDSILRRGFEKTIIDLIYPFLIRVGIMWGINEVNPAQEHFMSNLIRQKIIVAINDVSCIPKPDRTFVLFLPEGEMHEMGLMVSHYLLKSKNFRVIYLGQNVPFKDVQETCSAVKATDILCFITNASDTSNTVNNFLEKYSKNLDEAKLYVSGRADLLAESNIPENILSLSSIDDLMKLL